MERFSHRRLGLENWGSAGWWPDVCLERGMLLGARKSAWGVGLLPGRRDFCLELGICLAVRKISPNRGGRALASRGRPVGKTKFC